MVEDQPGNEILRALQDSPGATAREIAKKLSMDRRAVNRFLHENLGLIVNKDEKFRWFLVEAQEAEIMETENLAVGIGEFEEKADHEYRETAPAPINMSDPLILFDNVAGKTVAPNDKAKGALYITKEIAAVLHAAGKAMSLEEPHEKFLIKVVGEERSHVAADYYGSLRKGSDRPPEPRMGLEIISKWLEPGDEFVIANIGPELFAMRNPTSISMFSAPDEVAAQEILSRLSDDIVYERARLAPTTPEGQTITRQEFIRDQFVVRAALIRACDTCEMPGCGLSPFSKDDGSTYLEVHHIVPLSEGGEDSLANVAALCPNCHREQHHGIDRVKKRQALREAILALEA